MNNSSVLVDQLVNLSVVRLMHVARRELQGEWEGRERVAPTNSGFMFQRGGGGNGQKNGHLAIY